MLLIITSTGDRLFKFINIDDLEWPWTLKILILRDFLAIFGCKRVNYDEMDGDRLRLPANRNCYRLSRVSWALLKLLVLYIYVSTIVMWLGCIVVRASVLSSRGHRFDWWPICCLVMTMGKLFPLAASNGCWSQLYDCHLQTCCLEQELDHIWKQCLQMAKYGTLPYLVTAKWLSRKPSSERFNRLSVVNFADFDVNVVNMLCGWNHIN